jgi:hypothetical protein
MKKSDLERLVTGVRTPVLDKSQTKRLVDDSPFEEVKQVVAQSFQQSVAQKRIQPVAQEVAQGSWVAQKRAQKVAQQGPQKVAQSQTQKVAQSQAQSVISKYHVQSLVASNEVEAIKVTIAEMPSIEDRKSYLKSIGINIKVERRSNAYYFYGIKKIDGKKERFYCGRVC